MPDGCRGASAASLGRLPSPVGPSGPSASVARATAVRPCGWPPPWRLGPARAATQRFFALARLRPGARGARRRLRRARPARARAATRHHRGRPRSRAPATRGRSCARTPAERAAVRRWRVRPRVLLERDRARRARASARRSPRELRRVGRGWFVQTPAYSFPIEPHSLLPRRALAARAPAPPLLAAGRGRRLGRDLAAAPGARSKRLFGPARPSASGRSSRAGSCVSPRCRQTADVVADAVDHQEHEQR